MLAPLATARDTRGVSVRVVPFGELPDEVRPGHARRGDARTSRGSPAASWTPPRSPRRARSCCSTAPRASAPCRSTCARSAATSTPPRGRSGSAARTGIGYLYASPELVPDLPAPWPGYHALEFAERALEPALQPDARRLTTGFPVPHHVEWALAALDVLEEAGLDAVHARGDRGCGAPRRAARASAASRWRRAARSTLVSLEVDGPARRSRERAAPRAS